MKVERNYLEAALWTWRMVLPQGWGLGHGSTKCLPGMSRDVPSRWSVRTTWGVSAPASRCLHLLQDSGAFRWGGSQHRHC